MDVHEARIECLKLAVGQHTAAGDPAAVVATAEKFAAFVIPPHVESKSGRAPVGADDHRANQKT